MTAEQFTAADEARRFAPARARISADREASWLRRALPLVLAHRRTFVGAVVGAFAALVVQVQIPAVIGRAIDQALVKQDRSLSHYVWLLLGLALLRLTLNMSSRVLLLRTAYRIEYDVRTTLYEHLTRLSFSFFDRVQTGELMARSNSDVRAVQMYLAQAPVILAQCAVAVVVFAQMLLVSPPLAVVAMLTMPFVGVVAQGAPAAVSGGVAGPGASGRRRHDRRREHQWRAGSEVLRCGGGAGPPAVLRRATGTVDGRPGDQTPTSCVDSTCT